MAPRPTVDETVGRGVSFMCDFEKPQAYRERVVTARLVHDCYACGFPIVRGERYEHASGVWDGRGDDFRRHLLCAVLEKAQGECGCWMFGSLPEGFDLMSSWVLKRAWAVVMRCPDGEWSP